MEHDIEGQCHWFDVINGKFLQGLLLREGLEQRIYVVTFTPNKAVTPFARWPLLAADTARIGSAG